MPHIRFLRAPVATLALLTAVILTSGTAHAEARRSGQSLPTKARFSAPAPVPARLMRREDTRTALARSRFGSREDKAGRGRGHSGHPVRFDDRRYDNDRDRRDYEKGRDHEGHHFGHHGRDHDDSPGC